jgi:hypothetical protein
LPPCRGEPIFEKGENPLRGEHVLRGELNVTPKPIFSFFLSGELRELDVIPKPTQISCVVIKKEIKKIEF